MAGIFLSGVIFETPEPPNLQIQAAKPQLCLIILQYSHTSVPFPQFLLGMTDSWKIYIQLLDISPCIPSSTLGALCEQMKQLGKGCSKCSSLAMLWGLGGSREGETDYHFIKASSDCMGVCGLRMKMPPGQWKKWETIWLLFREETINVRISHHDRIEENSYFIPTSVGHLVTTQHLSCISAWKAWVKKLFPEHKQRRRRQKQVTQTQAKHRWGDSKIWCGSCIWINGHHHAQKYNGKQIIQNCVLTEYQKRSPGYESYKNTF